MADFTLYLGNKNYSSWSLRAWLVLKQCGVPFADWLRGPLREWAENLLSESRLERDQLLDPAPIRAQWAEHLKGTNWGYPLWDVLMLNAWLEANPGVLAT